MDYSKAESFKSTISQNEQYLDNIDLAKGNIDVALTSMDQINDSILSAKEIALNAADVSTTQDDYDVYYEQIDDIIEDIVSVTNSTFLDSAVFAGTNSDTDAAFVYNGTTVTYTGNDKKISRKIAENYDVQINVTGQELMDTDMFKNLLELRNALSNGDETAITDSIDKLDSSSEEVTKLNSSLGSVKMQIENTENRLNTANLNLESYLSNVEDADMIEVITNYESAETAYQAALSAASSSINLNILSFLG